MVIVDEQWSLGMGRFIEFYGTRAGTFKRIHPPAITAIVDLTESQRLIYTGDQAFSVTHTADEIEAMIKAWYLDQS